MEIYFAFDVFLYVLILGIGSYLLLPCQRVAESHSYRVKRLFNNKIHEKNSREIIWPVFESVISKHNILTQVVRIAEFPIKTHENIIFKLNLLAIVQVRRPLSVALKSKINLDDLLSLLVSKFETQAMTKSAGEIILNQQQITKLLCNQLSSLFYDNGYKLKSIRLSKINLEPASSEAYFELLNERLKTIKREEAPSKEQASVEKSKLKENKIIEEIKEKPDVSIKSLHEKESMQISKSRLDQQLMEEIAVLERELDCTEIPEIEQYNKYTAMSGFTCYINKASEEFSASDDTLTSVIDVSPAALEDNFVVADLIEIAKIEKNRMESDQV